MKSTGEVMGIGKNLREALFKGLLAAGYNIKKTGGVFVTVMDQDKAEAAVLARDFERLGFDIYATEGTGEILLSKGINPKIVKKMHEQHSDNTMTLLESGKISYIISTSPMGNNLTRDSVKIRRKACLSGIPCLTSIDTANAVLEIIESDYTEENTEIVDINNLG
jgi:carbamoyl-phosphate synthase large subunit